MSEPFHIIADRLDFFFELAHLVLHPFYGILLVVSLDAQLSDLVKGRPVRKSRTIKRLSESARWNKDLLARVKGLPWNPTGAPHLDVVSSKLSGDLGPGKVRRMQITKKMIDEKGATEGCPACVGDKKAHHTEKCRLRFEALCPGGTGNQRATAQGPATVFDQQVLRGAEVEEAASSSHQQQRYVPGGVSAPQGKREATEAKEGEPKLRRRLTPLHLRATNVLKRALSQEDGGDDDKKQKTEDDEGMEPVTGGAQQGDVEMNDGDAEQQKDTDVVMDVFHIHERIWAPSEPWRREVINFEIDFDKLTALPDAEFCEIMQLETALYNEEEMEQESSLKYKGVTLTNVNKLGLDEEKLQEARADELDRVERFDVKTEFEADNIPEELKLLLADWNGEYETMIWADAIKQDGRVRSQYNTGEKEGLFAPTPDTTVLNYMWSDNATDRRKVMLIWDVTSAFYHAVLVDIIVGKPPPELCKTPNTRW